MRSPAAASTSRPAQVGDRVRVWSTRPGSTVPRAFQYEIVAAAGWLTELRGPRGGYASLITREADGAIRHLVGRQERRVVRVEELAS